VLGGNVILSHPLSLGWIVRAYIKHYHALETGHWTFITAPEAGGSVDGVTPHGSEPCELYDRMRHSTSPVPLTGWCLVMGVVLRKNNQKQITSTMLEVVSCTLLGYVMGMVCIVSDKDL
jgi:hypothetical protein